MDQRKLGSGGPEVSAIGLGCKIRLSAEELTDDDQPLGQVSPNAGSEARSIGSFLLFIAGVA